jgi:hypothetical protein
MTIAPKKPIKPRASKPAQKTAPNTAVPENNEIEAPENEVLRETRAANAHKDAGSKGAKLDWKTAAGLGVGSAAVIAALLYANRGKK